MITVASMKPLLVLLIGLGVSATVWAQAEVPARRIPSPPGATAVEVGGRYDERAGYVGGKWIEIRYGRPIKRGRDLFGPSDYAEMLNDGAPVWRAGANMSTRLNNEVPIVIGGKTIAPGEYTVFIDLQPDKWILIISTWKASTTLEDEKTRTGLYGAYDYTPDHDVIRLPMVREVLPHSFEQLSWEFLDMTEGGGRLALIWDTQLAWVPFQLGK
jgi:hypothetical protein